MKDFHFRSRAHIGVLLVLQTVMAVELLLLLARGLWLNGVWLLAIMVVTGAPAVLRHRLPVCCSGFSASCWSTC